MSESLNLAIGGPGLYYTNKDLEYFVQHIQLRNLFYVWNITSKF